MKPMLSVLAAALLSLSTLTLMGCDAPLTELDAAGTATPSTSSKNAQAPFAVSGSAVHYFSRAIVHSQEPTATGLIQHSTDIVELTGDLQGYVLYHPTSVIDFSEGTLVNTGTQIFSGTVAGSDPVILHDGSFRFEVDLATNATTGAVHLGRSQDAPTNGGWYECDLVAVGTGVTPEGDNLSDYSGTCTPRGTAKGPGLK